MGSNPMARRASLAVGSSADNMPAGALVCAAWYYTILSGFYCLYCPVMYIIFFNHNLYRRLTDVLFSLWELYPVALFQSCCGTKLHHYGDYVNPDENAIMIVNHRTRVDWNYVWLALYHATQEPTTCFCKMKQDRPGDERDVLDTLSRGRAKLKFVLKDELKMVPGLGWIMQMNYFLYVKRNWREDQVNLSQFVNYYKRMQCNYRLVLFPEGTDLSEENMVKSKKYAKERNLQQLQYCLHPRTTGFAALCARLRSGGLEAVYDVTLAYDRPPRTEADLLRGSFPKHVHFHFKRYPIEELPIEEDALRTWLNARWAKKEESLTKYHSEDTDYCSKEKVPEKTKPSGSFLDDQTKKAAIERLPRSLHLARLGFIFWSIIDVIFLYNIIYSSIFQFWVLYHSLLFTFVSWYFGGFHNIQYKLLNYKLEK